MKLRNIIKKLRPTSLKAKIVSGLVAAGVIATSAIAVAGWSPVNRPIFDWNNPADHKGSLNGPVFNSFINTPYYGDERAFFDSARTDQTTAADAFKDVTTSPTQGTKEVILRSYIHNNANQDTNASGLGVAKNTRIRIDLPTGTATELRARSYINWDNPAPGYAGEVTDTTELVDGTPFSIEYIPGSAVLYTSAHPASAGGYKLNDGIVGGGVQIGHDNINGDFPGCFEYQATVEIRVRIKTPDLKLEKLVRKAGTSTYGKLAEVKPGDKIQWGLRVNNLGTAKLDDVAVSDQLPPHVQLVPGSVRYIDAAPQDVVQQDAPLFTTGGIGVGVLQPNSGFNIRFDTIAKDDFTECVVTVRNLGFVKSRQYNEIQDYADVKITKDNCNPVAPKYSCDLLTAEKLGDRKYKFTTSYSATDGAVFKNVAYSYGDGTGVTTGNATTEHTYAQDGTYNITATVTFTVNGEEKTASSPACAVDVDITPKPANPKYSCDLLTAEKLGDRKYRYTVKTTAENGATFKFATFDFGDGSDKYMTTSKTAEHSYSKDGTFVARAVVTFSVDGQDKAVDSDKCAAPVTLASTPVTPAKPTTPTVLPNTGAGNIFGIFAATSMIGAVLHRMYAVRKES